MFRGHHWTAEAEAAMRLAEEEARDCGEEWAWPEHLLLALLDLPSNRALHMLQRMEFRPEQVRAEIAAHLLCIPWRTEIRIERSPGLEQAIALAQTEARQLGAPATGVEHLLLALLQTKGLAGQALAKSGVRLEPARAMALALQAETYLLRPSLSGAPATEELLRPAAANPESHPEQLLRADEARPAGE